MPQGTFAPRAIRDLQRLRDLSRPESADAKRRAGEAIRQGVTMLGAHPRLGRMVDNRPEEFRAWLIAVGDSGHVVRHHSNEAGVTVLAIRHQTEAGPS